MCKFMLVKAVTTSGNFRNYGELLTKSRMFLFGQQVLLTNKILSFFTINVSVKIVFTKIKLNKKYDIMFASLLLRLFRVRPLFYVYFRFSLVYTLACIVAI